MAHDPRGSLGHPLDRDAFGCKQEVTQVPNPLAIGVTIGGLLLDVVVPRPKPRYGAVCDFSPRTRAAESRTSRPDLEQHDGSPVASGSPG
ncbi:MAG TPA: hypothetical protein VG410_10530 [Solirubrobacteraceae bacterium]|nr:hypothetical protein [Solirubrobacteraceae bacterium]